MENKYYNENYYNANTVLKFLRKVLNEINKSYVDSGMRTAFLMKRYIEKYKIDEERCHEHVLLCMLKDIGLFYMDGAVPSNDPALAAASSYAFLHQCSPLSENARPLLFYKAKYMEDVNNPDYDMGLLMTLLYQVSLYIYQRKDIEEIEEILREERKRKTVNPDQVKKVIKLLKDSPDIIEKLNSESELYVYETSRYISLANYGTDMLAEFLDTTSFMFEFHNHETMAHTVTTAQIAYDLAIACKLTESTSRAIEIAGKVHDIGKIRIPLEILCFPGKLEGDALAEMQNHAKYTKEIIEGCFSYVIVEIASRHHEKLDGSGYPLGITKKDLTSADKVLAVADICSALYCKRSYKAAFTPEKIQSILISDAKAGKLDERIVNHLIDDYDKIMANAKAVEDIALKKYETMKDEYEALAQSPALRHVFGESEEVEKDRPESLAADETEEYISGVINYDVKKDEEVEERIIYVDEDGNEIDYNPEDEEYFEETEEAQFNIEDEKVLDPLEEYNQAEMGDIPIEEIKSDDDDIEETKEIEDAPLPVFDLNPSQNEAKEENIDDEFDAFLNTIPEAKEEIKLKKEFVPRAKLTNPHADFDPFKEEIDPVFQEPVLPKVETEENIDDEFDAFLNTIPEVKEDPFKDDFIEESKETEDLDDLESNENKEEDLSNQDSLEDDEEIDNSLEEDLEEENSEETIDDDLEHVTEDFLESLNEIDNNIDKVLEETKNIDNYYEEETIDDESAMSIDNNLDESTESDSKEEIDDDILDEETIDDFKNEEIDSKYDNDPELEIDDNTYEEETEESGVDEPEYKEESKEDNYVTSYVDEDEFDSDLDEAIEDSIIPDESKYDNDPDLEIDDSSYQEDSKEQEETQNSNFDNKEDDYVTSYVDEDEFEEETESNVDEQKPIEETSKEDDYVTSYVDEDEFENESEPIEEEKSTEVVDSSVEENKSLQPESDLDLDDEDDEDEDEEDDEDESDLEEEEEEEEEDTNPKHKKFFSNDIYRKMFTYNPKNKKK